MPKKLTRPVRNSRTRLHHPRLIVLHTTEGYNNPGIADLTGLASFFNRGRDSAHIGNDAQGNSVRMVSDSRVAFTQGPYNDVSLSIEQIGFASQSKKFWITQRHNQLRNTSGYIAIWSRKYGIPIRFSKWKGVCEHKHISGRFGHKDCGPGYPLAYVLQWAEFIRLNNKPRRSFRERIKLEYLRRRIHLTQRSYGVKRPTVSYK